MQYRITDTQLPGRELLIDIELADPDDEPEVDEQQAEEILEWWDDEDRRPGRNFQILEDGGYIILAEIQGTVPLLAIWMQESNDYSWPLHSFPFNTVSVEAVEA